MSEHEVDAGMVTADCCGARIDDARTTHPHGVGELWQHPLGWSFNHGGRVGKPHAF